MNKVLRIHHDWRMSFFCPFRCGKRGQRVFNKKNPPEHLNMMYGSYFGFYSKQYTPSFNGTFKSRMSTAGTLTKRPKTREPHN
jgi:hypothetical protein